MVKNLWSDYFKGCRESRILTKLSEALYYVVGVSPHRAHTRHRLDRFYLFLWFFNVVYMITIFYTYFSYSSIPDWLINFIAYPLLLTYAGSVGIYMKENFKEKERGTDPKKRAGHIIVIAWVISTIALSIVAILTKYDYNTILRTSWELGAGTFLALLAAGRKSQEIKEKNGNGINGTSSTAQ